MVQNVSDRSGKAVCVILLRLPSLHPKRNRGRTRSIPTSQMRFVVHAQSALDRFHCLNKHTVNLALRSRGRRQRHLPPLPAWIRPVRHCVLDDHVTVNVGRKPDSRLNKHTGNIAGVTTRAAGSIRLIVPATNASQNQAIFSGSPRRSTSASRFEYREMRLGTSTMAHPFDATRPTPTFRRIDSDRFFVRMSNRGQLRC